MALVGVAIILYMYILQMTEKSKCLKKPNDNNNYNHNIEDFFDFAIHGDVCIDKPQQNTCDNKYK